MTKGWTKNEAEQLVASRRMSDPRSPAQERIELDSYWSEWTIITVYPGAPTTMERKPRQGLKRDQVTRVIEREFTK